jgi:hypothetical protein
VYSLDFIGFFAGKIFNENKALAFCCFGSKNENALRMQLIRKW